MNNKDKINLLRKLPHKEQIAINPYWEYDSQTDQIVNKRLDEPLDVQRDLSFVKDALKYFQSIYDAFKTEAQVLVLRPDQADHLDSAIPTLESGNYTLAILPQENTQVNSIIPENIWQKYVTPLTPFARIHSHHVFDAYQSSTDASSLNSGTLEIVVGHIEDEHPHVCYWLDSKSDQSVKTHTFSYQL